MSSKLLTEKGWLPTIWHAENIPLYSVFKDANNDIWVARAYNSIKIYSRLTHENPPSPKPVPPFVLLTMPVANPIKTDKSKQFTYNAVLNQMECPTCGPREVEQYYISAKEKLYYSIKDVDADIITVNSCADEVDALDSLKFYCDGCTQDYSLPLNQEVGWD